MARILLMDDDEQLRRLLQRVLEGAGHVVFAAGDGNAGLALLEAVDPQVVVTDIVMPDREGLETIGELRKRRPDLPVVAMSGNCDAGSGDYLRIAAALGARRTLGKPFAPQALVDAVAELLGQGCGSPQGLA